DLNPRHAGPDGPELPAHLGGGGRLEVVGVQVAGAAVVEDQDARPDSPPSLPGVVGAAGRGSWGLAPLAGGLGPPEPSQAQPQGPPGQLKEAPPKEQTGRGIHGRTPHAGLLTSTSIPAPEAGR